MSDFTTSAHPSTMTNSNNLNGNDTSTGGSMNMPIDISAELITRSMIKNGTKITKPIMNAVFNSESTNAGINVAMLTSSRVSGFLARLALMNRSSSPLRVCFNMKERNGFCASFHASLYDESPLSSGCNAFSLTDSSVGNITNKLRNSDR